MSKAFLLALLSICFALSGCLSTPPPKHSKYPRDLTLWENSPIPPGPLNRPPRVIWGYASSYSKFEWSVYRDGEKSCAALDHEAPNPPVPFTWFLPRAGGFIGGLPFRVEDGWLVGFNEGEFGAALYWFNSNGRKRYKISDHQIQDFFQVGGEIFAIEGLSHMGVSRGSLIRLDPPQGTKGWTAETVCVLLQAPAAVVQAGGDRLYIVLSDSIVSVNTKGEIKTLMADAQWGGLYPHSAILSADGQTLYIGMRQFVGEFSIKSRKFRLLIPSKKFLNRLDPAMEQRLMEQYGG